ncbi:hypothetical protein ACLOJK_007211 [Asimina triloba]
MQQCQSVDGLADVPSTWYCRRATAADLLLTRKGHRRRRCLLPSTEGDKTSSIEGAGEMGLRVEGSGDGSLVSVMCGLGSFGTGSTSWKFWTTWICPASAAGVPLLLSKIQRSDGAVEKNDRRRLAARGVSSVCDERDGVVPTRCYPRRCAVASPDLRSVAYRRRDGAHRLANGVSSVMGLSAMHEMVAVAVEAMEPSPLMVGSCQIRERSSMPCF